MEISIYNEQGQVIRKGKVILGNAARNYPIIIEGIAYFAEKFTNSPVLKLNSGLVYVFTKPLIEYRTKTLTNTQRIKTNNTNPIGVVINNNDNNATIYWGDSVQNILKDLKINNTI